MSCRFYNNNGYGCGGCCHFTRTTAVTLADGQIVITIPQQTVRNKEKTCICIAQNIPEVAMANTPVAIAVTGIPGTFALLNKCGNRVWGDQLRSRRVLHTIALTDVPAFKLCDNDGICRTDHVFATLIPNTTTAVAEETLE